MESFSVKINSDFEQLWRYNIVVMCEVMADGGRVELLKHESEVAPVGAELKAPPADYDANRAIVLCSVPATEATLYIYIIPHTLPLTVEVSDAPPFELDVEVKHGPQPLYHRRHEVNQWSGENIVIRLKS